MSTTELATVGSSNGLNGHGLTMYDQIKDPLEFITKMGTALAQSGVAGCKSASQGQVMAWACLSLKKNPFEIAEESHMIDGKLSAKADWALAEFQSKGGKSKWIKDGTDGKEAILELVGPDAIRIESKFTMDMARNASLVKKDSVWEKWPAEMLRSRCITGGIRMQWPGILKGRYSPEELTDVEQSTATTPAKRAAKSTTTMTADPVIDVTSEPAKSSVVETTATQAIESAAKAPQETEQPPFDVGDSTGDSDESTIDAEVDTSFDPVSLEIQMIIDKLGSNVAQICKTFNSKLGTTAAKIDDFSEEHRTAILEKLRAALAKFEQQKIELLPN